MVFEKIDYRSVYFFDLNYTFLCFKHADDSSDGEWQPSPLKIYNIRGATYSLPYQKKTKTAKGIRRTDGKEDFGDTCAMMCSQSPLGQTAEYR